MHLPKLTLVLVATLATLASAGAQLITTFGNTAENGGFWNYNPATSTITGTEGFGDLIFGAPANASLLTGNTYISLTGSAVTAPAGSFSVVLEDGEGNLAAAGFLWSAFSSGPQTVQAQLSFSTFDFDNVVGWSLVSGGSLQPVDASFSQMSAVSAVPEPSVVMLAAVGVSVIALRRRARRCK